MKRTLILLTLALTSGEARVLLDLGKDTRLYDEVWTAVKSR